MAQRLRLGFMGTGYPCLRHGEAFETLPGAEIAGVADPDVVRRKEFVQKFGAMQEFTDYRHMLAESDLDAVVIGLPTGMHARACLDSLNAGVHVLCEKPPTTNTTEMIKIARKAKQNNLTYMFCRQPRFTSASLHARKLVDAGRLGDVYHAEAKWLRCRWIPTGPRSWFLNKAKGGGVLLDLGIHAIDGAWFVMGCPRPVEVFAGLHCAFSYLASSKQEYTAEDAAVGIVRFENGATLNFTVTFSLNWPGLEETRNNKPINPEWRGIAVYGTHGGLDVLGAREIVGQRRGVRVRRIAVNQKSFANGAVPEFVLQAKEFLRAMREKDTPLNSAEQAVMLMQMLDALRKSGDTQRAIPIRRMR